MTTSSDTPPTFKSFEEAHAFFDQLNRRAMASGKCNRPLVNLEAIFPGQERPGGAPLAPLPEGHVGIIHPITGQLLVVPEAEDPFSDANFAKTREMLPFRIYTACPNL